MPHYRSSFFSRLHSFLADRGVDVRLLYGQERAGTVPRTVPFHESWATLLHNRYWTLLGREVVWQPCLQLLRNADVVIVEQANRLLINYALVSRRRFSAQKLAYWGHGANLQAGERSALANRFTSRLARAADWWFAYTELSTNIVERTGYPKSRITTVQNTIDTSELRLALRALVPEDLVRTRARLGIRGTSVAVFCGGMYAGKRLDFLVKACRLIRNKLPNFELIFVGDGPEQAHVETACALNSWMHYVGPAFGPDRAIYLAISQAFLMPGVVGLAVMDSFVSTCPMFTTDLPNHGPEIAYIEHGRNGWITEPDIEAYAESVASYFTNPALQSQLQGGCRASAEKYTLENMVRRFGEGVLQCLTTQRAR